MTDETNPLAIGQTSAATETSESASNQIEEVSDGPIDIDEVQDAATEATDGKEAETPEEQGTEEEETEGLEAPDPFEGYEDIEFEGKAYKVPAELKDGYMRLADYTRKTQEVAQERKTADAIKAEAETYLNTSKEVLEARVHLMNMDGQLKEYENTDWQKLEAEDPVGAMSAWRQFQQLQAARGNLASQVDQFQRQVSEKAEQETATRLRETRAFAEKSIPGWNEDLDKKIVSFANEKLGFSTDALRGAISPGIYQTLYLAWVGEQSLTRQKTAKPAPKPVAPTVTVSAKTSAAVQKDPGDMSEAEFVAYREAQIARRKA